MAARLAGFTTLTKSTRELAEDYFLPAMMERREQQRRAGAGPRPRSPPPGSKPETRTPEQMETMRMQRAPIAELSQQKILRAAYSERQLEEVLVDFWFNHFNVFVGQGPGADLPDRIRARRHPPARARQVPRSARRDRAQPGDAVLSRQLAEHRAPRARRPPAARRSTAVRCAGGACPADGSRRTARRRPQDPADRPHAGRPRRKPQQMRRRGLNENYARELMELHTLGVDGGYTQKDVQEVARAFTGWTIENPRLGGAFRFDPRLHDDGEKVVLGPSDQGGRRQKDGEQILDLLAKHPSTARFIATKLARRFVADDPPAALVDRAAETFRETDGDIREVVRTIVTSPEFFAKEAYRARRSRPRSSSSSARFARPGSTRSNALPLVQALRDLGMPLYGAQPPTGYADQGRRLGEHRRAAQSHELRGRADRRPDARRCGADASRTSAADRGGGAARRCSRPRSPATCRRAPPRRWRKRRRRRRPSR